MTEQERIEQAEVFDASIEGHEADKEGEEIQAVGLVLAPTDQGPGRLLEIAVRQDLDIDKLERLMAMQERWNEQQAKEAFYNALASFQKIVPVLEKRNKVDFTSSKGRVCYAYASLADIKRQIQEGLSNCGLSYRWEFADLEVTCVLTHLSGHSEKTTMIAPADTSGSKNPVQERASTITYLQRYTLIGALGLATANMDDDGRQGKVATTTPEESMKGLPPLPEGTDTKAPKPETPGKSDTEKRQQLYGYLCEITGLNPDKRYPLTNAEGVKFSAELVELTKFDEKPGGEPSLRNLKGKWLNTAIGKAKAKLGHANGKEELLALLKHPDLNRKDADELAEAAEDKRHTAPWYENQIIVIREMIADAEKQNA